LLDLILQGLELRRQENSLRLGARLGVKVVTPRSPLSTANGLGAAIGACSVSIWVTPAACASVSGVAV